MSDKLVLMQEDFVIAPVVSNGNDELFRILGMVERHLDLPTIFKNKKKSIRILDAAIRLIRYRIARGYKPTGLFAAMYCIHSFRRCHVNDTAFQKEMAKYLIKRRRRRANVRQLVLKFD